MPRLDEIGIAPSLLPQILVLSVLSVRYGCLLPRDIDGLLVAGRLISCDLSGHSFPHEIAQYWHT
jgi:hypothetical protein